MEESFFEDFNENIKELNEKLKTNAANIGFEFSDDQLNYDFGYSQGRGASFDGDINLTNFLNSVVGKTSVNEKERLQLIELIANGYIENYVSINKNQFANHYYHEKTRYVDYVEVYDESFPDDSDELQRLVFEKDGLRTILETERLSLCTDFIKEVDKYLDARLKEIEKA